MTRPVYTHCEFHIGDQILHIHLLRALAKQHPEVTFVHFCHACHLSQLTEVVQDLPNVVLRDFESKAWWENEIRSLNVWKNEGNAWQDSTLRYDWSSYYLWWHGVVARRMGFESPFTCREHLLHDWPALETDLVPSTEEGYIYDFLIGDSAPSSGQYSEWADHSKEPLAELISRLSEKWSVLTTSKLKETGCSISYIGRISQLCKHSIMVPNGPFWATLNTHNHHSNWGRKRIILLDNQERLEMPHIQQVPCVFSVMEIARSEGWL